MFFTTLLSSCNDDNDVMIETNTIVDVAINNNLTSLVAAVTRADLATTLSGSGPFTVFAPTNAAFQNLLDSNSSWSSLDDIPVETLRSVLLFHVLSGSVKSTDLSDTYVPTLSTGPNDESLSLQVQVTDGIAFNGDAAPVVVDVEASNGTVHVIDKVMLPAKQALEFTAYYTVGVFIASVVEAPGRAMLQIVSPLTAKAINESNNDEIESLYKRTSINLLIICGLFFVLINSNLVQLYLLIDKPEYSQGVLVVLMVAIAKLYNMFLGNNGAIISNSKHYRVLLPYGLAMAFSVAYLNIYFIEFFGMNGAALSTLIVILIFNTIKIWYVKKKFNVVPFNNKTLVSFSLIILYYFVFHFWDFKFLPVINILLKSSIISISYIFIIFRLNLSPQITSLINQMIYKIQSK